VSAVDTSTFSRWASRIAEFEEGQAEISDPRRSDRPTRAVIQVLLQGSDELTRNYNQITTMNPLTELSVSQEFLNKIIEFKKWLRVINSIWCYSACVRRT